MRQRPEMPIDPNVGGKLPDYLAPFLLRDAVFLQRGRGRRLFHLDEPVPRVYLVGGGELKEIRYQSGGRESIVLRSTAEDFFGESAMIAKGYACDAFSAWGSRVLTFSTRHLGEHLQTGADLALLVAKLMAAVSRRCSCPAGAATIVMRMSPVPANAKPHGH